MITPLVSVVVPVFNCRGTLRRSIDSLLSQELETIEVIVVDDASTDGSGELADVLAANDSRIKVLHNRVNFGVQKTRCRGVQAVKAPWIGFLDADDIAKPNMLSKMLAAGDRENADIVICGAYRTSSSGHIRDDKVRFFSNETVDTDILEQFCQLKFGSGMLWNKLYRKETMVANLLLDFPWRQDINEDVVINIGCFADAKRVHLMKDKLYQYVQRDASVSSSTDPVAAFVLTYRAYAIAVSLYKSRGARALANITRLYKLQLSWAPYRVEHIFDLDTYEQDVSEANELINANYPLGLAALVARSTGTEARWKAIAKRLIRR